MLEPRLWIVGDMLVHLAAEIRKPARLELAGHAARTQRRHFFLCPPPSSQKNWHGDLKIPAPKFTTI